MKCKYMFMFFPKKIARKGLIINTLRPGDAYIHQ